MAMAIPAGSDVVMRGLMKHQGLNISLTTEVVNSGKEIGDSFKNPENKSKRSISENIVMIIMLLH